MVKLDVLICAAAKNKRQPIKGGHIHRGMKIRLLTGAFTKIIDDDRIKLLVSDGESGAHT